METTTNDTERNAYLVLSLSELERIIQALKEKRGDNKSATAILRSSVVQFPDGKVQFRSDYSIEV